MLTFLRKDDSGAVALIFVLVVVLLIVFASFAVDVGFWYTSKWQLQSAADAAALAGCQDLAIDKSDTVIWDTVTNFADRNFGVPLDGTRCYVETPTAGGRSEISRATGNRYVKVTVFTHAPAFLSRVSGLQDRPSQRAGSGKGRLLGRREYPRSLGASAPGRGPRFCGGGRRDGELAERRRRRWHVDRPSAQWARPGRGQGLQQPDHLRA